MLYVVEIEENRIGWICDAYGGNYALSPWKISSSFSASFGEYYGWLTLTCVIEVALEKEKCLRNLVKDVEKSGRSWDMRGEYSPIWIYTLNALSGSSRFDENA